jgi:RNA polymerase sigma-70 factor, ECF subfamily
MDQLELEWLARYRSGEVEALGKLVEHHRRPLFSFINRMLEGHSDAEEIFQEVWFRAIRSMPSYRDDRFLSWLFRIAHNLVVDRSRKMRPTVDIADDANGDGASAHIQLADQRPWPDRHAAGRDLGNRIAAAVERLPAEQREVFILRTEGDLPFKEIAHIQGISINTALARMQYALRKLRGELRDEYKGLARGSS